MFDEIKDCSAVKPAQATENKTYVVLQQADYTCIKGISCHVSETRVGHFCGTYGHQTFVPNMSSFGELREISPAACREMYKRKGVKDSRGKWRRIELNQVNHLREEAVGSTYYTDSDVTSEGGRTNWKEESRGGVNIYTEAKVLVEDIDLIVNDDDVIFVKDPAVELPCPLREEGCTSHTGTYTWKMIPAQKRCRYFKTRVTTGVNAQSEDGKVFVSEDSSLLRFVHRGHGSASGHNIIKTNYKKLVLSEELDVALFNRPLHFDEVSDWTYTNVQDEYLRNKWHEYVEAAFVAALKQECQHQRQQEGSYFVGLAAEQRVVVDGDTAAMGKGSFATAAGEVWYRYSCKQIQAVSRDEAQCYSALPVDLAAADRGHYIAPRMFHPGPRMNASEAHRWNEALRHATFYLELKTHRIITTATPVPCWQHFAPMYKNALGQYIQVKPRLIMGL